MRQLFDKVLFRLRIEQRWRDALRTAYWNMMGASIAGGTKLGKLSVTWPHQVRIGTRCCFEDDVFLKFDGFWKPGPRLLFGDRVFVGRGCEFNIRLKLTVGDDCLIASGCKFIDHDHGMVVGDTPMNRQSGPEAEISLGSDVWLGVNVVVLKGVTIDNGAVVAAGSIVNKSIGPNEIWAGIPAKRIGSRLTRGAVAAS